MPFSWVCDNRGVTSDPWQPPEWHVTISTPYHPVAPRRPALAWPHDLYAALFTALLVALSAPLVGLLWSQLAPTLSLRRVLAGAESPFKAQIGADIWFLLLAAIAGVLCAVVAFLLRGRGPGTLVGLAVGGMSAALIADRVGFLAQRGATTNALRAVGLDPHAVNHNLVDFKVRALGVLIAWPLAAVLAHWLAVSVATPRD